MFMLAVLPLGLLSLLAPAYARAVDAGTELVREANRPTTRQLTQAAITQQAGAFLNDGQYEVGYLYLLSGRRVLVLGLRYHVGQRVVEVQDSLQADSTVYWPLSALRGFDLGIENDSVAPRRYRSRLVQASHQSSHYEAVQVLTATDAGPLLLAWLPVLLPGTTSLGQMLLAGGGHDATQPLRSFNPGAAELRRLLRARTPSVQAFARTNNLHYCVPQEVAQMLDCYNRLVVMVN
jgi:hypothetical protein